MGRTRTAALAAAAVTGSYLGVRTQRTARFDAVAARMLRRSGRPGVDRVLGAATDLGSVYGLGGVAVALAVGGRRRASIEVVAAGTTAWVAAQAVKPALHRPRPYESDGAARLVAVPAGSSWPSGHAAVVAAMSAVLWPRLHPVGRLGVVAATTGVAATRLHVGVHHATDVIAGIGVGVLAATAARAGVTGARRRRSGPRGRSRR